ncbi:MAG: type III-B CRISPR module-associated protein Cmr5 [Firmicutes bacterium]|nr:type III-B CRISPR module-associated protein Cmr5 [Bacillota bacterium]
MSTLEQERARYAWEQIDRVKTTAGDKAAEVAMHLRGLPAMVLANGLGQSLAFLLSKAKGNTKSSHYVVYDVIAEWVVSRRGICPGPKQDLIHSLMQGDRSTYQRAQDETWALLVWLKKFADAYIGSGGEQSNDRRRPGR